MASIDQSGFDDQLWIDAAEAAALLGVKRATLYAYVSRGHIRSTAGADRKSRRRRYHRGDVMRLAARAGARRGHAAVAAGALRWGEPVLDTAITEIAAGGPRYRGRAASELIDEGAGFEPAVAILWAAGDHGPWPTSQRRAPSAARRAGPVAAMAALVPLLAAADRDRRGAAESAELVRARALIAALAAVAADHIAGGRAAPRGGPIAARLLAHRARPRARDVEAVDAALIAVADHGVAVSTFAARLAASAGADLYACVSAALAAFGGPAHGGATDRIEAFAAGCASARAARVRVRRAVDLGDPLPGFDHPLYPGGDPRSPPLRERAKEIGGDPILTAIARAARDFGRPAPTVDFALVELAAALGMPPGSAAALFAVGRSAGWVAHVLEQRRAGYLLRPRARFTSVDDT